MVDQNKESVTFIYKSSFVNSYLILSLKDPKDDQPGEILIKSDNYSVLTIMKDQINSQATQRSIQISFESEF